MRLAVLAFTFAASLAAETPQVNIRVEVTSGPAPVDNAAVSLNGATLHTGPDGRASTVVTPGKIAITVAKEGYFPSAATVTVEAGRDWLVQIQLHPIETAEEEITVHATRSGVRIQDSPLRVEILAREEIEEKLLMAPGDIVMMLNEMGGMRVQTTSPALGAASVRVQGMRGRYTRFLSDGLPLFGQQGAGLGLLQIPPMDLGQVEVIKGTSSALYGAGAMAGVVNLLSRRPSSEPVRELLVNRTTLGGTDAAAFLASHLSPSWGVSFLGGGHAQERRDRDGDRWADLAGYGRGIARPRFYYDGRNGRTALLTGGVTYENRSGGTLPDSALAATGAPYLESLDTRRYDLGGNVQAVFADRYVASLRFSASSQRHGHRFGEVRERDRHDLLFGEISFRGSAGPHTWVAGAAAERDVYRPRDVPRFRYTYSVPGFFLQDDVTVTSWLSVSASARADFHNQYGTFFSPRVSALLRWSGWTTRLSAGQGFYAPTPLTEETEAAGLERLSIPRALEPERGRGASVDLTRALGPVSFTTTLFTATVRHPIHVNRGDRYEILNLPEPTVNRGLELLGTWRKAPFAATASYTYVRSRESDSGGGRADVPLTPRHSFGLVGMWEQEEKGRLGVELYYTGRQRLEYDPYRGFSKPYVLTGVMAERRVNRYTRLFVNFENLTNVRQTRWNPLLRPGRAPDGRWTVDAWAPLDGRAVNGGVRLNF